MVLVVLLAGMLALAVSAPFLTRALGRDAGYPLAAGFAAGGLVVATQAPGVLAGRPVQADLPWIPGLGVRLHLTLDGLALVFALLVLGVGVLVMTYSARYFASDTRPGRAYGLLTLFAVSMLGLVLADDVLVLFVFWEITTVCSFFLIGNRGEPVAKPATRALLVTGLGGLALLAGLVLAGVVTGSFELRTILVDPGAVRASGLAPVIGALIVLGCLTKSAQVPFHFWLPGAMVADTPISAYLHAATMVKPGSTCWPGSPRSSRAARAGCTRWCWSG
ncbi:MAG TPA: proton-conducting transporter membrane subunit [Frankiaceae bacterium]|nr:proton-conducting transporter membrane subunit [Frankiaceae bacterium]